MVEEIKGQKAFQLRDARDLIHKLGWELTNLYMGDRSVILLRQYHTFNCALTAWHISDWLWHDLTSETKELIANTEGIRLKTYDDFRDYIFGKSHALKLCHQIANGTKHCLLRNKGADATVSAKISTGEGHAYGNPIIVEGDIEHDAQTIFYEAMFWYQGFIHQWDVFPEEPFVPKGDP